MKLEAIAEFDERNTTTSKKVIATLYPKIMTSSLPIYGQRGAIQKPDSGGRFYNL